VLVTHERGSGLLLFEQAASDSEIRRLLKRLDPDLVLGVSVDARHQAYCWKVGLRQGDRPALWLFDWRTNVEDPLSAPRPLSTSIVDEAASRRIDSRRPVVDPLKANDELIEKLDAEEDEIVRDIARDVRRRAGRITPAKPSVRLRMTRDKMRARGENV